MPLVSPTKRDQAGLAGSSGRSRISPRIRRVKPKPLLPPKVKKAIGKFGHDVMYGSGK